MTRFIKVMPLLALFFGLTVFLGNAAVKKQNILASTEWMHDGGDPTLPENYSRVDPGTQDQCAKATESICVVIAPADASNTKPVFDQSLKDALAGDLEHDDIIKGPYNP